MSLDDLGPAMEKIGIEIAKMLASDPDGAFLYVECGEGWVEASVFQDEGDFVRYHEPSHELNNLILAAWHVPAPDKRWVALLYEIHGTRFDVKLIHPEEFASWGEPTGIGHRTDILKQRYGTKRIVYPNWFGHLKEK